MNNLEIRIKKLTFAFGELPKKISFLNSESHPPTPRIHLLYTNSICLEKFWSNHDCLVPQQVEAGGGKVGEKLLGHLATSIKNE